MMNDYFGERAESAFAGLTNVRRGCSLVLCAGYRILEQKGD